MIVRGIKRLIYNMEEIKSLEERVSKIEFVFGKGAEDTVRKIQEEILQDLYRLRETLKEDLKGKSVEKSEDNKELLDEIKKLKEENTKLHYRISHLKRHIQ